MQNSAGPVASQPSGPQDGALLPGFDSYALPPILKQYWHTVLRWKWFIIGLIAASLVVGLIVTLLSPSRYTAKAQIEISREQKKVTNVEGLESQGADRDLEFYETQYALLRVKSLADRVAKSLGVARRDEFFAAHGVTLKGDIYGANGRGPLTAQQLAAREKLASGLLLKNVEVTPVRRSRLVTVGYTSRSPEISQQVASAWVRQFIRASMDRQLASTADARRFLEGRLAVLRVKLEQSERDVVGYASRNDIVTLDTVRDSEGKTQAQRTMVASDLEALNTALIAAKAERISAESRANSARGGEDSVEALGNATIAQLRQRRADVASEYAKMIVRFEPGYPAAQALKVQIKSLDDAIARETARVSASRSLAYREALARENDLGAQVAALKVRLDRQQNDSIQYNIYQREADTNRQLYDALLQRYKEIGIAGMVGVNNIVIVDDAELPGGPTAPRFIRFQKVNHACLVQSDVFVRVCGYRSHP